MGKQVGKGGSGLQKRRSEPAGIGLSAQDTRVGIVPLHRSGRNRRDHPLPEPGPWAPRRKPRPISPVHKLRSRRATNTDQLPLLHLQESKVLCGEPKASLDLHGGFAGLEGLPPLFHGGQIPPGAAGTDGPETTPVGIVCQAMPRLGSPGRALGQRLGAIGTGGQGNVGADQRGMLPCFFVGFRSRLFRSISRALMTRSLVSLGSITSSR